MWAWKDSCIVSITGTCFPVWSLRFKQPLEYAGVEEFVYCFDNRYMFPSLDLMVQHYFRKSLKDHNPGLDTFLKYPVGYYLNSSSSFLDEDGDAKDSDFDSFSSK